MTRIAVLLKGYPRLSETFIAQELHGLEQRGARLTLVSLRHPTDRTHHPIHEKIEAPVLYLPEYLHQEVWRVFRATLAALANPRLLPTAWSWLRDLVRDPTRNRIRRFGQALVLARELDPDVRHLYAHFLHTPSSVARYTAKLTGLDWSASAHAVDIWTTPEWEKQEKLDEARFIVTCTRKGQEHLTAVGGNGAAPVHLAYHGLDWSDVPPARPGNRWADGSQAHDPVRLLTVARAVEKKGLDILLTALAQLPKTRQWTWTLIGDGPLMSKLRDQTDALGIRERITFAGSQSRTSVFDALQSSDLFVLPSRVSKNGDRDGLPNVLMEAMSQSLPCLASDVSAIPELITHDRTGWLVPPEDPGALSLALDRLITDPACRHRLGEAGHDHVRARFGAEAGLDLIATALGIGARGKPDP